MTSEQIVARIYAMREVLKILALRQETEYTDEREQRIVTLNLEVCDLKVQLHRAVLAEQEGQPA